MPYCTQCGKQIAPADAFCGACGAAQSSAQAPARPSAAGQDPFAGVKPRTVATLCYVPVAGCLAALYALAAERFRGDRTTRFHAFQGLYLFVAWLILDWGMKPFFRVQHLDFSINFAGLLRLALLVTGIVMIIKTHRNEDVRLPIFGDLADRSLSEQR